MIRDAHDLDNVRLRRLVRGCRCAAGSREREEKHSCDSHDHHSVASTMLSCSRLWRSLTLARIFSSILLMAKLRATPIAFLIAFAFERPWQTMQPPFTPRSGAPPYSE